MIFLSGIGTVGDGVWRIYSGNSFGLYDGSGDGYRFGDSNGGESVRMFTSIYRFYYRDGWGPGRSNHNFDLLRIFGVQR